MRLLTQGLLPLVVAGLVCLVAVASHAVAHPPSAPTHGIDPATYYTLWSGDEDREDVSGLANATAEPGGEMRLLAAATDIPLDTPPKAVEQWNRQDHRDFPADSPWSATYPPHADRTDGAIIRDAHVTVFTVQPSTRARLSPGVSPLFVAQEGTVLGVVDYRVVLPDGEAHGANGTPWRLGGHEIVATRLLVNGQVVAAGAGTRLPSHDFSLDGMDGDHHTLTLEATIAVEIHEGVGDCSGPIASDSCLNGTSSLRVRTEEVTVSDSVEVVEYELESSGYRGRYPDGDLAVVVFVNNPWLGHSLPEGEVNGVWRFYSARDERWDTLVTSTGTGESVQTSPMHPLQVSAFPIEAGPTTTDRETVRITEVYGREVRAPTLPEHVHLDVVEDAYLGTYGIETRTRTHEPLESVRVTGLVRGTALDVPRSDFVSVRIHRSELTLTVTNVSADTVTVEAHLADAATGGPIDTSQREGHLVVEGVRVNTNKTGRAVVTVPRSAGGIASRYEPARWWRESPGYVGDSDVVYVRGTVLHVLSTVWRIAVPVGTFLLAVFMIDRITGWRVWPLWRGL